MKYKITLVFAAESPQEIRYYKNQIDKAIEGHDNAYPMQIKIFGTRNSSNCLNFVSLEEEMKCIAVEFLPTETKGK